MSKHSQPDGSARDLQNDGAVLASAPSGRARLIVNAFIIAWLAWQLVVPLSYYISDNVDDERFSWRMFSGVWLLQKSCAASVTELVALPDSTTHVRKVNLERTLHGTWVSQLKKKNRPLVVEKFLQTRCERDPAVVQVEYLRTCSAAPDTRIPPVSRKFDCRAGAFTGP